MEEPIQIGLLGLGTVGGGVFKLLKRNGPYIAQKLGRPLEIKRILVRDLTRPRSVEVDPYLLTTDPLAILKDPEIEIVVEVMGGLEPAREYVLEALRQGKSVVTANKDLLALHGKELFAAAEARRRDLLFEASVGGGIPIIHSLKECLAGNRISQVMGIVNGTTNYILTKMSQEGRPFTEVLAEAQRLGYAEADPAADIEGDDAARKMAILASISFGTRITYPQVYHEGISHLKPQDIEYAARLGYAIKLLGIAREREGEVEVRVHPALLPLEHPLAQVHGAFNAIFVEGDAVGQAMFYGLGAGEMPTASAVVGDIMEAARNIIHGTSGRLSCTCLAHKPVKPIEDTETRYYLRMIVKDRPGVLAAIAGVFGDRQVSLASVIQVGMVGEQAELVFITHKVRERNLREAVEIISGLPVVKEVASVIRVEGERGQ